MTVDPDDISNLATSTATTLRDLQVSLSDKDAELRGGYVRDVIDAALAKIVPSRRRVFLEKLQEWFPTWNEQAAPDAGPAAARPAVSEDASLLKDPNVLAARLAEGAKGLSDKQRKDIAGVLRKAGLVAGGEQPGAGVDLSGAGGELAKFKSLLGLSGDQELSAERLVKLLSLLVAFETAVGRVAWATWKVMAPKSSSMRQIDVRKVLARYVSGDAEVTGQHAETGLNQSLKLATSIISAIGQLGRQFASQHLAAFSPDEIESIVKMEPGRFLVAHEVKCWRKYSELARESLTQQALERAITDILGEYAESLFQGTER